MKMTLGELRHFLASLEASDDAVVAITVGGERPRAVTSAANAFYEGGRLVVLDAHPEEGADVSEGFDFE